MYCQRSSQSRLPHLPSCRSRLRTASPAYWKSTRSAIPPIAQKDARKKAARYNARCSALRWPTEHAAMADAPHCVIYVKSVPAGSEKRKVNCEQCCAMVRGAMPTSRQPNSRNKFLHSQIPRYAFPITPFHVYNYPIIHSRVPLIALRGKINHTTNAHSLASTSNIM